MQPYIFLYIVIERRVFVLRSAFLFIYRRNALRSSHNAFLLIYKYTLCFCRLGLLRFRLFRHLMVHDKVAHKMRGRRHGPRHRVREEQYKQRAVHLEDRQFSLKKGTVMCSVDYDNYSGDLSEAPAEPLADDPDCLFVTRPEGTFFSKTHSFEILLGEEDMHIAWADTCEYDLYRSDGSAEELENETVAFENSESYQTMMEKYDTMFHSFLHRSKYIEEEKTVYTFVALG